MIELIEAPQEPNIENMTHEQMIYIIRRCPRSNFFAYSQATLNTQTWPRDVALNELKALAADRELKRVPEPI